MTTLGAGSPASVRAHRAALAAPAAPSIAKARPAEVLMLPEELLGGDEIIVLAIKPSPWFILFDSIRWVVAAAALVAGASWIGELLPSVSETQLMSGVLAAVSLRIGLALLRWVSQVYVLTNRRVLRLHGVLRVQVEECRLVHVRNTAVLVGFGEALTKLGTLQFASVEQGGHMPPWRNLAGPHEIHRQVRRAIERALDLQPHI